MKVLVWTWGGWLWVDPAVIVGVDLPSNQAVQWVTVGENLPAIAAVVPVQELP